MGNNKYPQIINSILDNDLYALTMSQAALQLYPKFRTEDEVLRIKNIAFPEGFVEELREQINLMANLALSEEQAAFLKDTCYYLTDEFIEWFKSYRFDPQEIEIKQNSSYLKVYAKGRFCRTAFWETPILALISELYYIMTKQDEGIYFFQKAEAKGRRLRQIGAHFSEFGSRRRFSFEVQKSVLEALIRTAGLSSENGVLNGTSNVQLAMDLGLTPMGTNAHKWYQLHAGLFGIRMANKKALEAWQEVYDTRLGIALTDTFTTDEFLKCFDRHLALLYDGVRQDSGDPIAFTDKILAHYKSLDIDPMSKTILFSDSLNIELVEKIVAYCAGKIKCAFGIGTFFSNDIEGVEPLRIVMKQIAVYMEDGRKVDTVKLSDDPANKASGNPIAIMHAKYEIGIANITAEDFKNEEMLLKILEMITINFPLSDGNYSVALSKYKNKL